MNETTDTLRWERDRARELRAQSEAQAVHFLKQRDAAELRANYFRQALVDLCEALLGADLDPTTKAYIATFAKAASK